MKRWVLALVPIILAASALVRADTHQFIPTVFYSTYSFAHPPALRIKPGDRVVTKTIDAGGVDWNGKTVASGGNPETGPFYIDGAEPGDMIVVSIEKLETNRASAYAGSLLAPYTVDPGAIAARVDRDPKRTPGRSTRPAASSGSTRSTCSRAASSSRSSRCWAASAWRRRARKRSRPPCRALSAATWTTRRWEPGRS